MSLQRERKLDITKLPPEQVDIISEQLGGRIREICDKACDDANRLLNVYGMQAKMQIVIDHPDLKKTPIITEEPKKKRGRPRKAPQSLS